LKAEPGDKSVLSVVSHSFTRAARRSRRAASKLPGSNTGSIQLSIAFKLASAISSNESPKRAGGDVDLFPLDQLAVEELDPHRKHVTELVDRRVRIRPGQGDR
jgi:hypothetical protein